MSMFWPDDKTERLKNLWANGYSARLCAAELGMSRNAVIGKVHRLGLEARGRKPAVHRERGPRKPRRLNTPHKRDAFDKLVSPFVFVPRVVEVEPQNWSFDKVTEEDGCRYPTGESPITFCGHPKQKASSYCASHHALCWVPWRPTANREQVHVDRIERFRAYKAELVEA